MPLLPSVFVSLGQTKALHLGFESVLPSIAKGFLSHCKGPIISETFRRPWSRPLTLSAILCLMTTSNCAREHSPSASWQSRALPQDIPNRCLLSWARDCPLQFQNLFWAQVVVLDDTLISSSCVAPINIYIYKYPLCLHKCFERKQAATHSRISSGDAWYQHVHSTVTSEVERSY